MFRSPKHIGQSHAERGILTDEQVQDVLDHSSKTSLSFYEAAEALGLLKKTPKVGRAARDFFHLDPTFFPASTRDLLGVDEILRWGVLPLGIKKSGFGFLSREKLNLGFLDPARRETRDAVRARIKEQLPSAGIRVYLVIPDEFLDVLATVYRISESEIRSRREADVEPVLWKFLT